MDDNNQQDEQQNHNGDMEMLQKDLDTITNNWKRALADFENFKRRSEAEKRELLEFAKEVTVVKLLPTIDTLEQALKHLPVYSSPQPSPARGEGGGLSPLTGEGGRRPDEGDDFANKYDNWQTGVKGIVMQLDKVLEDLGVKKITAKGQKFDPNFHEVLSDEPGPEEGLIVRELQTGYTLNGKVIRPSQVVVQRREPQSPIAKKNQPGGQID